MSFVWSHDKNDNQYWAGLSTLHSIIKFIVFGEIALTAAIIGILFIDYKQTYGNNLNPLNLNYDNKANEQMMNY